MWNLPCEGTVGTAQESGRYMQVHTRGKLSAKQLQTSAPIESSVRSGTRLHTPSAGFPPRALPDVSVLGPQSTLPPPESSPAPSTATGTQASAGAQVLQGTKASKRVRIKVPVAPVAQGSGASASARAGAHVSSDTAAAAHGPNHLDGVLCRTTHIPDKAVAEGAPQLL